MLNLALSLSLLVPSALAEEYSLKDNLPKGKLKADQYALNPGSVGIDGVVEVPLYSSYSADRPAPMVAALVPDSENPIFIALSVGQAGITLTEGTAGKAGASIKEKSGGKVAVVPELRIGELVLSNVKVRIGGQDSMGLTTFSGLATAVLPSEGVVRFAPVDQADGLLSAVGAPVEYSANPTTQVKYQRKKIWVAGNPVVLQGTINGQEGPIYLDSGAAVAKSYATETPVYTIGLDKHFATQVVFGDMELQLLSVYTSNPPYLNEARGASVPAAEMASWNLAIDPSTQRIAIKPQSETKYVSTWDIELAQALSDLETAKLEEDADLSGAHSGLAGMYMAKADSAKALEYATLVVDAKPESCTSHRLLGQAQAQAGQHTQAIATLSAAGELYQTWADMDLETRDELAEAALENPELKKQIQTHSCFDVWGMAAQAALEIGDFEQVGTLYVEHHDLDASLAQAAAAAYLAQERYHDANAALVQMRLLSTGESAETALTRAVVQHAQGNPSALDNYKRAAFMGGLVHARAWGTAVAELQGAEGTTALAELAPFSPHVALAYAEAVDATGGDSAKAWADALSAYEAEMATGAGDADVWAGYGRALRQAGKSELATAALKSGLEVDAEASELLLLAGDMAADADDYARAKQLYAKAAKGSPTTATYAGLLSL